MDPLPNTQPVFRFWLNLKGPNQRNVPDLLRHLADTLERREYKGYEVVDLGIERWFTELEPDDENYDTPVLRVYLAAEREEE